MYSLRRLSLRIVGDPPISLSFGRSSNCFIESGFHNPQLLGLAMGIDAKELAIEELRIDATKILSAN